MNLPAYLHSLAARLFHGSEAADDLDEELRSHIALRADDLERSGVGRAEAQRRARIEFGGYQRYREAPLGAWLKVMAGCGTRAATARAATAGSQSW